MGRDCKSQVTIANYKIRLFVISYSSPTVVVARELEAGIVDKLEGCLRVEDKTPPPSQFVNIDDIVQLYLW